MLRFAMTGENFFYKNSDATNEISDIFYPDVALSIPSVFDQNHPSHLLLLVDKNYIKKPKAISLSWNNEFKEISRIHKKKFKWNYDNTAILNIQNKDNKYENTCFYVCDGSKEFNSQLIHAFHKDGSLEQLNICKGCMLQVFKEMNELRNAIDFKQHKFEYTKLKNVSEKLPGLCIINDDDEDDVSWPQIPLGQILWVLLNDYNDYSLFIKSWITIIVEFGVKISHNYTYCPNHSNIIYEMPRKGINLKCPFCDMFLCTTCNSWHNLTEKCLVQIEGIKYCPYCHTPTIKISGCSQMCCPCGFHWCYRCENSPVFQTAGQCYEHLKKVHGDYYS